MLWTFVLGIVLTSALWTSVLVGNICHTITAFFKDGSIDRIEYAGTPTGELALKAYKGDAEVPLFEAVGPELVRLAVWTLRNNPEIKKEVLQDKDEWRLTPA